MHRYLRQARFRNGACLEEIDLDAKRRIDINKMLRLSDGTFIRKRENLLITVPTGVVKSYIASQLPVAKWYEVIGESTIVDAILDRMIHTAHRINLKAESR